jgi:hypothetical protein
MQKTQFLCGLLKEPGTCDELFLNFTLTCHEIKRFGERPFSCSNPILFFAGKHIFYLTD